MGEHDLPPIAMSVRQPWAWAIVAGHKRIENRTRGAIRSGGMDCRRIAIHAAKGLKEDEFHWGYWRLHRHGVQCPHPAELPRSAIIGVCEVVDIIEQSDSEWFGGPCGLVLENASMFDPIPAKGALGYFEWQKGGTLAPPTMWMNSFDAPNGDENTLSLFDRLEPSFKTDPSRPSRKQSA
ncbi:ASCH domain-containing protein [Cognatiyoonia sediminum]|uniref:ASCH domain-containing protein n=1 Tax=Cognatiyoonia sediminum TaxID=1508389 RepID=A0A1M5MK47_9RHOB|nr:ASCH domain-containing protein [Cognatiyoonia sediminum]SHG77740.1 ASCH domain-containing protein [Cognatiyoonia sediminum]